jgi:branched-chain amino acid transport system substrate-binding protein
MGQPSSGQTDESRSKFRRRDLLKAGGVGAVLLTAGCSGDGGGDPTTTSPGDEDTTTDGGGGGTATTTSLNVDGPIVFGSIAPLPGEFAAGTAFRDMGELYVNQLNEDGGLLGTEVELVGKDSELDPSTARDRYRELVLQDNADVTFGIFQTESGNVIQDELSEFETLHISGGVAGTNIPEKITNDYEKYKYWFRSNWNGRQQGSAVGQFAQEQWDDIGYEKIAIVDEDVAGFAPIVKNAIAGIPEDVEVAFRNSFSSDTSDFTPILDRAESEDIDFMFAFIGFGGVPLTIQWSKRDPDFGLGGADIFSAAEAHYEETDGAIEGIWTYVSGSGPGFEHTQKTRDVIDAHEEFHGRAPVHANGFTHYESIDTFVEAVRATGSLDTDDLISYIESDLEYTGVTGPIRYHGPQGRYPHDTVYRRDHSPPVIQWQDGRQVGLWPEANKTGDYQDPS